MCKESSQHCRCNNADTRYMQYFNNFSFFFLHHGQHLFPVTQLMLVIICAKYGTNPSQTAAGTEWTWKMKWMDAWWRYDMDRLSPLLSLCDGNESISHWWISLTKGQWRFFLHVCLNKLLNKQWNYQWIETPWCSCDVTLMGWLYKWYIIQKYYFKSTPFTQMFWQQLKHLFS